MQHPQSIVADRGMSLFELVLVVAIVATLAAVAAPRFSSADRRYRADAAARRIVADLDYVARTARARSAPHAVSFSLTAHTYVSSAPPLDVGPDEPYTVRLDVPPYRARLVGVDFEGNTELTFSGYGRPEQGGEISVAVGDIVRSIRVDVATGEVVIE